MSKDSKVAEVKVAESLFQSTSPARVRMKIRLTNFESISEINRWDEEQMLMWLKVCLTGRALMVY